jgi:uncharacterized membrane protein YebE (DUF533 family)
MNRGVKIAGLVAGCAIAYMLVNMYQKDERVKEAVDISVQKVTDLISIVQGKVKQKERDKEEQLAEDTVRNQRWVDQQWESLGI